MQCVSYLLQALDICQQRYWQTYFARVSLLLAQVYLLCAHSQTSEDLVEKAQVHILAVEQHIRQNGYPLDKAHLNMVQAMWHSKQETVSLETVCNLFGAAEQIYVQLHAWKELQCLYKSWSTWYNEQNMIAERDEYALRFVQTKKRVEHAEKEASSAIPLLHQLEQEHMKIKNKI